jgi:phosphoserine phosphatase RsbU/P
MRPTAVIPPAVVALLDAFGKAYPAASLRLWEARPSGWACMYPEGGVSTDGPTPSAVRKTLAVDGNVALELELDLAGAPNESVSLLTEALQTVLVYDHETRTAAVELAERYEEINLLYSISEILGSVLSLESASKRILDEVVEVLGARRASLWVYDEADRHLHLTAEVGESGLSGPVPRDDPISVTAWVFRERQAVNLERGSLLKRGTGVEPRPRDTEPFLSVPINYTPPEGGTRTVGVITLIGHRTDVRFSAGDTRLLSAIASQIGAALETHRLVQESLRRERLMRELELAHHLQLKLLPETKSFDGAAQVAARCEPADSVGGDFYHLFRLPRDRFGVVIGDVAGHGFSAALIMALTMSAVAIYAQEARPPGEVMQRLHDALIDELESTEMYMTLFYGVVDSAGRELLYANAGHPHAFSIRSDGSVERLRATTPPLGTAPVQGCEQAASPWEMGSSLLCLFTDGLSDAYAGSGGIGEVSVRWRRGIRCTRCPAPR